MVPPHLQNRIETPWHRGQSQTCLWDLHQARVWVPDLLLEEKALDSLPSPRVTPPGMLFPLFPLGTSGSNGSASVSFSSLTCWHPSLDSEAPGTGPWDHISLRYGAQRRDQLLELESRSTVQAPCDTGEVTGSLGALAGVLALSVYWKRKSLAPAPCTLHSWLEPCRGEGDSRAGLTYSWTSIQMLPGYQQNTSSHLER